MRIGCCLNMLITSEDPVGLSKLRDITKAGYDYIELPTAVIMAQPESVRKQIQRKIEDSGLSVPIAGSLFPSDINLQLINNSILIVDYLNKALDYLMPLGIKQLVFDCGNDKNIPLNITQAQRYNQLTQIIMQMDSLANEYDINFIITPLRPQESSILNTLYETRQFLLNLGSTHIFMLADLYNMHHVNEGFNTLTTVMPLIKHVHLSRVSATGCRMIPTQLSISETAIFNTLNNNSYQGCISIASPSNNFYEESIEIIYAIKSII